MPHYATDPLRLEIAAAAARLIADSALDYASAKRRAARQIAGDRPLRSAMPDNDEIDAALLEHLNLFDDEHPRRVFRRRQVAAALMRNLADFSPYLTGAVWKGIVAEHAPIHLQLFHDDPKEIEIALLNAGIRFDVETLPHFRDRTRDEVEAIVFWWREEPVMLSLYLTDDLRGALRATAVAGGPERGDLGGLEVRIAQAEADPGLGRDNPR
jgi:hypothetical protein